MGFEFGKRAKNAIRAAVLGGAVVGGAANADAGPRNMPPMPPTYDAAQRMQAADLARIEASKNALNMKVAGELAQIEAAKNAMNKKVADELRQIDEATRAHAESAEGREELRQLKKQYGLPSEE